MKRWIIWLLDRLFERHDIGRDGSVYLTRWVLWGQRFKGTGSKLFLHQFHRSDEDEALHDHPWDFWSLILCGGYWEWTPTPVDEVPAYGPRVRWWYGPLSLLRRPCTWKHRVQLLPGRDCWTLIWASNRKRSWGFWCGPTWVPWKVFVGRQNSGQPGCGDEA